MLLYPNDIKVVRVLFLPKKRRMIMKTKTQKRTTTKTRLIAGIGMLSAAATVLQYLEIPSPVSFIALDFSDLPALIGAFAYGPVAGIVIELVKNLIHLAVSKSGYVGELSNFLLGAVFTGVAGLIYSKNRTKKGAIIGGIVGAICMGLVSLPSNYYIVYPFYYNFMPKEAVLEIYQKVLNVKTILQALIVYNIPFTIIKGIISVVISALVYKPLSPLLHGKK